MTQKNLVQKSSILYESLAVQQHIVAHVLAGWNLEASCHFAVFSLTLCQAYFGIKKITDSEVFIIFITKDNRSVSEHIKPPRKWGGRELTQDNYFKPILAFTICCSKLNTLEDSGFTLTLIQCT